ncbi:uncharacterized protein LY89DRAFT_670037 [Mollisia scopiformis]|uniref:Uncharacterized protein n=1 Tax=Mollisia scopiformis TaxID=149040 RepID=A0A194X8N7_MOLSC|nr:uncharacterized protein LY89DRAFT_670037 [Mollisia scopiformis]KUJ16530.1 hypothetical protein LY89DRAFT_670037 [Mollisia scopiformis]
MGNDKNSRGRPRVPRAAAIYAQQRKERKAAEKAGSAAQSPTSAQTQSPDGSANSDKTVTSITKRTPLKNADVTISATGLTRNEVIEFTTMEGGRIQNRLQYPYRLPYQFSAAFAQMTLAEKEEFLHEGKWTEIIVDVSTSGNTQPTETVLDHLARLDPDYLRLAKRLSVRIILPSLEVLSRSSPEGLKGFPGYHLAYNVVPEINRFTSLEAIQVSLEVPDAVTVCLDEHQLVFVIPFMELRLTSWTFWLRNPGTSRPVKVSTNDHEAMCRLDRELLGIATQGGN